jgi:large subunit ribosomal protein L35
MKKLKQKTRKGAVLRFKITGTGKVMRRRQNSRHLRRKKSKKAIRSYRVPVEVKGKWAKKIKRMMGLA